MVTISELECKHRIQYSEGECRAGYCHAEGSEMACGSSSTTDVSDEIKALRRANDGKEDSTAIKWLWLKDAYGSSDPSCHAYTVKLSDGSVGTNYRNYSGDYALCK